MSNTLGQLFKVTNWGESHGKAIGVVVDGCPSLLELKEQDIQKELDRRSPGQSKITTKRKEPDKLEILSGVFDGKTTGTPISLIIKNKDFKKKDYTKISNVCRPSHADYTYQEKYGIRNPFGGGRSSARITAGNVAAGAIAKKLLKNKENIEILAYVKQIHNIKAKINPNNITLNDIESNIVRCPDKIVVDDMIKLIEETKKQGDSVGGTIECVIKNVPPGLGEPIFNKLSADLSKSMMSINASKGFEIGSGFNSTLQFGSEHNDPFTIKNNKVMTEKNNSGGIQGGISNGMPIIFRVAFKPTSTISKSQDTINIDKKTTKIAPKGRHDPCVLPRAVPIVEAMAAIAIADHYLMYKSKR